MVITITKVYGHFTQRTDLEIRTRSNGRTANMQSPTESKEHHFDLELWGREWGETINPENNMETFQF